MSGQSDNLSERANHTLKPVREFIGDWPYTPLYLQATLDADLIGEHGRATLFRCLDYGRTVCFVGSGVSMAYGRLGWGALVRLLAQQKESAKAKEQSPTPQNRMRNLLKDLNLAYRAPGDDLQSGRYPAAIQFIEQMDLLQEQRGESRPPLRDDVRKLLFDDRGHVAVLYDELINDLRKAGGSLAEKDAEERAGLTQLAWGLAGLPVSAPTREDIDHALMKAGGPTAKWRTLIEAESIEQLLGNRSQLTSRESLFVDGVKRSLGPEGSCILPLRRFALFAVWRLTRTIDCLKKDRDALSLAQGSSHDNPNASESLRQRPKAITPGHDPLLILTRDLSINRFLTTNYDLDIERLLSDRGFTIERPAQTSPHAETRAAGRNDPTISTDALGGRSRDELFQPEHAIDLMDFSVQGHGNQFSVFHMHGRATAGAPMLMTERDYLELYLQRNEQAEVVNDAISMAFSANPMLFVGSGMSEDDILRPLRQFMSERKSRLDRAAIVLLPALGSRAREIEDVIALYSRYGIHAIHYGIGCNRDGKEPLAIRWLSQVLYVVQSLKELLQPIIAAQRSVNAAPIAQERFLELAAELEARVGRFDPELALRAPKSHAVESDPGRPSKTPASELRLPDSLDRDAIARRTCSGETSLSSACEMGLLNQTLGFVCEAVKTIADIDLADVWFHERTPLDGQGATSRPRSNPSFDEYRDWQDNVSMRLLLAHDAILNGLPDAFIGLSLCAKLQAIRDSHEAWKRERQVLPLARPTGGQRHWLEPRRVVDDNDPNPDPKNYPAMPVLARHPIALKRPPITDGDHSSHAFEFPVPDGDRFFSEAPSQTFRTFYEALRENRDPRQSVQLSREHGKAGRRVFVFVAPRGVGKGHFFEALRSPRRLGEINKWSWPDEGGECEYAASAHFNLSFSQEVISIFDRLTSLMVDRAHVVFPSEVPPSDDPKSRKTCPALQIWNAYWTLRKNRIARLAAVLRLFDNHAKHAKARILVVINGFNFLFDERGNPKNAELYRVIVALLGPLSQHVPIDLFLICTEANFPATFTRKDHRRFKLANEQLDGWDQMPHLSLEHLIPGSPTAKRRHRLERLIEQLQIDTLTDPSPLKEESGEGARIASAFVHVLHEARTSNTAAKYFPEVALSIAAFPGCFATDTPLEEWDTTRTDRTTDFRFERAEGLAEIQRTIVQGSTAFDSAVKMIGNIPRGLDQLATAMRTRANAGAAVTSGEFEAMVRSAFPLPAQSEAAATVRDAPDTTTADREADKRGEAVDENFATLARMLGHNRFLLTICCAAAAELAWEEELDENDGRVHVLRALEVVEWLRRLQTHLSNVETQDRDDQIIKYVLDEYERRHEEAKQLPAQCGVTNCIAQRIELGGVASNGHGALATLMRGTPGWSLQLRLLWHVAIVGNPVEADVLARAPKIREACRSMLRRACGETPSNENDNHILALVRAALDLLVHRCLVFRLLPAGLDSAEAGLATATDTQLEEDEGAEWINQRKQADEAERCQDKQGKPHDPFEHDDPGWRFAVHRYVQRAIFRRLHSPVVEFPHIDPFGLSMWATQPDDLPRPNRAAALDIADLIAEWTGFPQHEDRIARVSEFHRALNGATTEDPSQAQRTLPARLLRASFGIVRAVYAVGVVARFHDFEGASALQGPDEGFFEQHRLQVRWLIEQTIQLRKKLAPKGHAAVETEANAPLFDEEIVWLYNECGLFCLVEGRLHSAAGLFRLALRAAEHIEGTDRLGALSCRIHLNLAMVDIERGRIREARRNLMAIRSVADENPILRVLAHGFVGLVEHLSGNLDVAEAIYKDVVEDLDKFGQSRSVAIFSRHLAELYRVRGKPEQVKAVQAIDRSIAAAGKGGHEDVRQLAHLARVRLAISGLIDERPAQIQRQLDQIERYGVEMGMPRLIADTAYARARHLMILGETRHAASLACKCIETATINGLHLRQMTALALLAKIYGHRGMTDAAAQLMARAQEMAKNFDYSNTREVRVH